MNFKIEPMLSHPSGLFILIGSVTLAALSTVQLSLIFLFIAFLFDFLSGIFASWVEWKNKKIKVKTYLIESVKLRKSIGKAVTYMAVIGFTYGLEALFFIKSFNLAVSDKQITITLVAVGVCIAIEFFSILENTKRSGFDLIEKINTTAKKVWKTIRNVKGESNDTPSEL
ncbi:MAG: phage holin family protein [Flavobacteriales bacterium]|nr:phage holin family protein [Flavobacteriales bacterium]